MNAKLNPHAGGSGAENEEARVARALHETFEPGGDLTPELRNRILAQIQQGFASAASLNQEKADETMKPHTSHATAVTASLGNQRNPTSRWLQPWWLLAAGLTLAVGLYFWQQRPTHSVQVPESVTPGARARLEAALERLAGESAGLSDAERTARFAQLEGEIEALPAAEAAGLRARMGALHARTALAAASKSIPRNESRETASNEELAAKKALAEKEIADLEATITSAFKWFGSVQEEDGRFDCAKNGGLKGQDVAATALAVLSHLGAGNTSKIGMFKNHVAKGIQWLSQQTEPADATQAALRTLVLCENAGMTNTGKEAARAAVSDLVSMQAELGGWLEAAPEEGRGKSVDSTVWAVLALKSAKVSGLVDTRDALQKAVKFLEGQQAEAMAKAGEADIAAGVGLARLFSQAGVNDATVHRLSGIAARNLPAWNHEGLGDECIAWYHATLLTFCLGGAEWNRWNAALKETLLTHQTKAGAQAGSWESREASAPFRWGRIGTTALSMLSLEVYFRYLPISQNPAAPIGVGTPGAKEQAKTKGAEDF